MAVAFGSRIFGGTPQGVVAVRHINCSSCTLMAALIDARFVGSQGDYSCNDLLEAPCHCRCQWISTGWTCNSCYNTGSAWCYLRSLDTNTFEILTFHREDWVRFRIANDTHQDDLNIWIHMIHVMQKHRRRGRARWMLQRVQNHFPGRELAGLVKEFEVLGVHRESLPVLAILTRCFLFGRSCGFKYTVRVHWCRLGVTALQ